VIVIALTAKRTEKSNEKGRAECKKEERENTGNNSAKKKSNLF
jgi:hypothetical protein